MSEAKEPKLKEIVEHHLAHEINMLFGLLERLTAGITDRYLSNAAAQSFCIHARSLIDFLESKGKPGRARAKAVTYDYEPSVVRKIDKAIIDKIHNQIAHLGLERTLEREQMISPDECSKLVRAILAELLIVQKRWRPEYEPTWQIEWSANTVVFKRRSNAAR